MSVKVSVFRPDFSKTNVCKVSEDTWTVDIYDEKYSNITLFLDDSDAIISLATQLISLTAAERVNPYKVEV
jgi:hypothetical protein